MKKYYNQPELEVSEMVVNTIICASNGISIGGDTDNIQPEPGVTPLIGS